MAEGFSLFLVHLHSHTWRVKSGEKTLFVYLSLAYSSDDFFSRLNILMNILEHFQDMGMEMEDRWWKGAMSTVTYCLFICSKHCIMVVKKKDTGHPP